MRQILLVLATTGLLTRPLVAQDDSHHHEQAGRAAQIGRVAFPVSCAAGVQRRFERAVALLHSFWYEEAARGFREIARSDTTCAMAHWGEAMSLLHPLWTPPTASENETGLAAAKLAVALSRSGSRERAYADAIAAYYTDYATVDHKARLLKYERAMGTVADRYRTDDEARIFYALALIANGQNDPADTTLGRQRRAGGLLEPLFRRYPRHPGLAHYLIHAYDYPALASRGVPAAGRYALIAPSVPHAQHMPSHIYVRVGRWDDVVASNLRKAGGPQAYWSGQVRIQRMTASAWLSYLNGDTTAALSEARAAADLEDVTPKHPVTPGAVLPARELYGDLLVETRHEVEARQAYEATLALQPRRARSLAGLAPVGR